VGVDGKSVASVPVTNYLTREAVAVTDVVGAPAAR